MENEEIIDAALAIVKEKASNYSAFSDQYYIVTSHVGDEDEMNETGSCEDFCEKCIDRALAEYKTWFYLERAQRLIKVAMAEEFGYYLESYLEEYVPDKFKRVCKLHDDRILVKVELPAGFEVTQLRVYSETLIDYSGSSIFDYRYSAAQSGNGFATCDMCGEMFNCFYMSEQEIEHWEDNYKDDDDLVVANMSDSVAWQLENIFESWSEKDDLTERVVNIAIKLIEQNKIHGLH